MSEMELFKTAIRGYDKDEVNEQVQKMKSEAAAKQLKHNKELEEKDEKINELLKRLEAKDAYQERLEREIHDKYQKYIDNYESIGKLVFEAKIKAEEMTKEAEETREAMISEAEEKSQNMLEEASQKITAIAEEAKTRSTAMIADAEKKSAAILAAADAECKNRIYAVQKEVDDRLNDGKKKYLAVQEELNTVVELINRTQKCFMSSYKEVHRIIDSMPAAIHEVEMETHELPAPSEEEEVHLGDSDELDILDTADDMEELEEFDSEEEVNQQLVDKIQGFLEEGLEEYKKE